MDSEFLQPTRNFFSTFFTTMGIIFIVIVLSMIYILVADPFGFRPMLLESAEIPAEGVIAGVVTRKVTTSSEKERNENELVLSVEQRDALRAYGIDPSTVPTTITPLQLFCFEEQLGVSRVSEIRAGAVPTAFELFRVKTCLSE